MQRSRLVSIRVNFAGLAFVPDLGAIQLTRTAATPAGTVGTVVNIANGLLVSPSAGWNNYVNLTFANVSTAGIDKTSLADGRWQLSLPGIGYASPLNDPNLRRLAGDSDNNGVVDTVDLTAFGNDFNSPAVAFDFDANQVVNSVDLTRFGNQFNLTL